MAAAGALHYGRRQTLSRALSRLVLRAFRSRLKRNSRTKHLPLTPKQWRDAFDPLSGRLIEGEKIMKRVRYGGVELKIRGEVWLFLLNFYDLESTEAEREAEKTLKRAEYDDLKRRCIILREKKVLKSRSSLEDGVGLVEVNATSLHQDTVFCSRKKVLAERFSPKPLPGKDLSVTGWQQEDFTFSPFSKGPMTPQATEEFSTWQRIIRLDAVRMNAEWVPYSPSQASVTKGMARQLAMNVSLGDDEHLEPCVRHHAARLVAILEAYALYDPETGYCQGMSDLLSPFVALLDEDYQAFWCFAHFMYTARHNFRSDEMGIRRQLQLVARILKVGDPQLYKHLEKIQAADCFFVYRMIVVLMRRELSFEQTISFWEILWADKTAVRSGKVKHLCRKRRRKAPPSDDLLLYVVAAAVRRKRNFIMENCICMDDTLRACNSMAGHLDVWALLDEARKLLEAVHA